MSTDETIAAQPLSRQRNEHAEQYNNKKMYKLVWNVCAEVRLKSALSEFRVYSL